jgi:hypothetical protein
MNKVIYILIFLAIILGLLFASIKTEGFNDDASRDRIIGYVFVGLGILFLPFLLGIPLLAIGAYFLSRSGLF